MVIVNRVQTMLNTILITFLSMRKEK